MQIEIPLDGILKSISGTEFIDSSRLREDVKILYDKYSKEIPRMGRMFYAYPTEKDYEGKRKFYVYEWFTKDKEKVFYVGKGTGRRCKHILSDIVDYGLKCYRYQVLQDNFGIDYRIVADKLTSLEAEIYEVCWIRERYYQGEVLLQSVNVPNTLDADLKSQQLRNFTPTIKICDYKRRYFDVAEAVDFDAVELELLRYTTFLFSCCDSYVEQEKELIMDYLDSCGGRVYTTLAKNAKSVIEFGILDYDEYKELKEKGYVVYHSFRVLDFIKATPPVKLEGANSWERKNPTFDISQRDSMRAYLKQNEEEINKIIEKAADGFDPEMRGLNLIRCSEVGEAINNLEASVRVKPSAPAAYLQLAVIYRKFGMFEEELAILGKGVVAIDQNNTCAFQLQERLRKVKSILNKM